MAVDYETWMPDALDAGAKAEFTAAATLTYIDRATGDGATVVDHHLAAAKAWEHYAATGAGAATQLAPGVESVSTGDQSITYRDGGTRQAEAMRRAAFHRARSKARTVRLGGPVQMDPPQARFDTAIEDETETR